MDVTLPPLDDPTDWGYVYCDPCALAEDQAYERGHLACDYLTVYCGCFCPWLWPDGHRPRPVRP